MNPAELATAVAILAFACAIQGAVGFGANLIAAPLLVLIDPSLVPGPLIAVALVLNLLMIWREDVRADNRDIGWALVGRVPGTVAGAAALVLISSESLELFFGVLILVAVGLSAWGPHIRPSAPTLVGAGTVSGFMGTSISVGGPAMAMAYQGEEGPVLRGTLGVILAIGSLLSLVTIALIGRFGVDEAKASLVLLPAVFVGFFLSTPLTRVLDRGHTKTAVLALSGVSAVVVLLRAVL